MARAPAAGDCVICPVHSGLPQPGTLLAGQPAFRPHILSCYCSSFGTGGGFSGVPMSTRVALCLDFENVNRVGHGLYNRGRERYARVPGPCLIADGWAPRFPQPAVNRCPSSRGRRGPGPTAWRLRCSAMASRTVPGAHERRGCIKASRSRFSGGFGRRPGLSKIPGGR